MRIEFLRDPKEEGNVWVGWDWGVGGGGVASRRLCESGNFEGESKAEEGEKAARRMEEGLERVKF